MLTFEYQAKNSATGQKIKSKIQADNEQTAAKLIREQGLVPLDVEVEKSATKHWFRRIKTKDKVLFSRQLATLINAGLPLAQALHNVSSQTSNKALKVIINQIVTDVESGVAFSQSLENYPQVFNRVFVSLVAAGEESGTLEKNLERLADQQEKDADILSKVRGAMIYPLVVLLVMVIVVAFMLVKVLPQVQNIYAGLHGVSLPIFTRLLLAVSHFLTHFWWVLAVVAGLAYFLGSRWRNSIGGRSVVDGIKLKAWPTSNLYMKMYMARFSRTAYSLVSSGVPIIKVLEITGDAVDNVHISASLNLAIKKVTAGKALSEVLAKDPNFLELVPNMLRIGEMSGSLDVMLAEMADYYEKELDNEVKNISTIIEPAMMIIIGLIAIIVVAAILLPIYGLVNQSGFTNNI